MSQLLDELREEFRDEQSRYEYVEAYLNTSIAAQIKKFRGKMSQQDLADLIGTKQSGISRLENANYSSWKVETLRKLAKAFHLRLKITFEEFGSLVPEIERFEEGILTKRKFEADPAFSEDVAREATSGSVAEQSTLQRLANIEYDSKLLLDFCKPTIDWSGQNLKTLLELATIVVQKPDEAALPAENPQAVGQAASLLPESTKRCAGMAVDIGEYKKTTFKKRTTERTRSRRRVA